jgi:tetratricopeptide (TPR) repeat protein
VDPITRTCSLIALTLALGLTLPLGVTPASARPQGASALAAYVKARLADAAGVDAVAIQSYEAALTADPASKAVAGRAYRQALEAGNRPLALRAARTLEVIGALPPDARILLVSESIAKNDWRGATAQIDKIEEAGTFAFLAPVLRAWVSYGARLGDPLGALAVQSKDGFSAAYAQEHRGLMLLALKQNAEGADHIRTISAADRQGLLLRLSAAARLVENKDKARALALLSGDEISLRVARDQVTAGGALSGAVSKPNAGIALLLARVANDLLRDNASPVALTMARLASLADPSLPQVQLAVARALAATGSHDAALAHLDKLPRQSNFIPIANDLRYGFLIDASRFDSALEMAKASASAPNSGSSDQVRLGEAYSRAGKPLDAAAAYRSAIDTVAGPNRDRPVSWALWFFLGRAYDDAKDWKSAKPALERAVALGPNETAALNHLGYGMLVNGDNIEEATRLIKRASALRPTDPAISDSLAWALYKGGKALEAIPILERAVAIEPTIAEIGEHLGDVYWSVGRRIDARYAWSAALVQAEEADVKRLSAKIDRGVDGPLTRK